MDKINFASTTLVDQEMLGRVLNGRLVALCNTDHIVNCENNILTLENDSADCYGYGKIIFACCRIF